MHSTPLPNPSMRRTSKPRPESAVGRSYAETLTDGRYVSCAITSRKGWKFRIKDIQFGFKRTGDDTMTSTRRQKGRKTTRAIERTTMPLCAPHLRPIQAG